MSFNLTGIDEDLYFTVSTVVCVFLFIILVLPALTICLLCVLALIFSENIKKIIVLLINFFAAEVCNWLSYAVYYLSFPTRILKLPDDYSCHFVYSSLSVSAIQIFTASALFAVMVCIFIRYGEEKMKWSVIISVIFVSWIVVVSTVGMLPYFHEAGIKSNNGFCSVNTRSNMYRGAVTVIYGVSVIAVGITITCSILTFVYIRKHALEDSVDVKKAVAKLLIYLTISSFLSFIGNVIPATNPAIRQALAAKDAISLITLYHFLRILFVVPSIATPIVALVLLKPLNAAVKSAFSRLCCACRCNALLNTAAFSKLCCAYCQSKSDVIIV